MLTEVNPFEYSKPLVADEMAGRDAELAELVDRLAGAHNCRLVGPRRYGKTTLINAALAACERDGLVTVKVNFLGVLTLDDIAERIERAYSEQLDSGLRRWFAGLRRTLRPTATAGGGPVPASVSVSPGPASGGLLDRLALPREVLRKHGRRTVVAFDEFQDVIRAGVNADGVIRSEIESHAGVAGYVFSGSHVGMMRELFADRRRAFYGQASAVELGPLDAAELGEYVAARFAAHNRDVGDALGPLLDLAGGHPQRALLLAHMLFHHTEPGTAADGETWLLALDAAFREADPEVVQLWSDLGAAAQRVLAVIADGTVGLNSQRARERFGLAKSGANQGAVQRLADTGLVAAADTRTGFAVVDPLLSLWLRSGRSWPATD